MSKLEKFGLMLMLLGVSIFRDGGVVGWLGIMLLLGGYSMFLFGEDAPNTGSQSDGVPPQEPGDVTPPDVHEKMWRLRQSRRR